MGIEIRNQYTIFLRHSVTIGVCLLVRYLSVGQEYDLPVLPDLKTISDALKTLSRSFSNITSLAESSTMVTQIPKIIWLTMKNSTENYHDLPENVQIVLDQNPKWVSVIADNKLALEFMQKIYANTSLLWAYESINPILGASKADIWRYAVLYAVGGVYFDADAAFMGKLDDYIRPDDQMILSVERNALNPCYKESYHLHTTKGYHNDRVIIQWIMLTSPQHLFLEKTLINVVDVIKSVYKGKSVLLPHINSFHMVMCTTGPCMWSNTIKNVMNSSTIELKGVRFDGRDYRGLGGIFKWGPDGPDHYANHLKNKHVKILRHYENNDDYIECHQNNETQIVNNTGNHICPSWTYLDIMHKMKDIDPDKF